ncbi:hypothetical protein M9H77_17645 [Catharanthus roseus]|uniref:Uncharacterized protein n=1 Tax=Catharanthus roseus TaxID=4058 RepID=A0ACC0B5E8_CATRO|nr:hypothetical protein M9H77_17645 [Catharanthus roseus]
MRFRAQLESLSESRHISTASTPQFRACNATVELHGQSPGPQNEAIGTKFWHLIVDTNQMPYEHSITKQPHSHITGQTGYRLLGHLPGLPWGQPQFRAHPDSPLGEHPTTEHDAISTGGIIDGWDVVLFSSFLGGGRKNCRAKFSSEGFSIHPIHLFSVKTGLRSDESLAVICSTPCKAFLSQSVLSMGLYHIICPSFKKSDVLATLSSSTLLLSSKGRFLSCRFISCPSSVLKVFCLPYLHHGFFWQSEFWPNPSGAISILATLSGNVIVTSSFPSVEHMLCPVEEFSPPWKSCGYPNPKTVAAVFENHLEPGELRGQVTTCKSTVTVITLSNLRHIYAIPNEYFMRFIIICQALGVPSSYDLFRRQYGVHHNKDGRCSLIVISWINILFNFVYGSTGRNGGTFDRSALSANIAAELNTQTVNESSRVVGTSTAAVNRASKAMGISIAVDFLPTRIAPGDLFSEDSEEGEKGLAPNWNRQRRISPSDSYVTPPRTSPTDHRSPGPIYQYCAAISQRDPPIVHSERLNIPHSIPLSINGVSACQTDKGKVVYLPQIDDPFFDNYSVSELDTGATKFCSTRTGTLI